LMVERMPKRLMPNPQIQRQMTPMIGRQRQYCGSLCGVIDDPRQH
jgi:hypothetical protein